MSWINQFLMGLSDQTRATIYDISVALMVAVFFAIIALLSIKSGNKWWKSLIGAALAVATYYIVTYLGGLRSTLTHSVFYSCGVIEFMGYAFCGAIPVSLLLKSKWLDAVDKTAPAMMLGLAVQGIGCCFTGCCQGEEVPWGIWSGVYDQTVIPVQVVECILLFSAWTAIFLYYRKKKYQANGKVAAFTLIAFGGINVITDAFTVTFPNLVFENSLVGVIAFLTMCVGLVMLYLLDKKQGKTKLSEQ